MLIETGEKLHVVYRAIYENSTRRHFIGEVSAVNEDLCRLDGYAFVFDTKQDAFLRKEDKRTTFVRAGDSGYIVNVVPSRVSIEKIYYKYMPELGLIATDGIDFTLNISEFSFKT